MTNNKGYTLLEVILALGILSASLVGIIHAFVTVERSGIMARQHTQALLLQEYKLNDLLQEKGRSRLSSEGVFAPPFERFHWKTVQGRETGSGFKDVHLSVSWDFQGQPKEVTLSTYVRKRKRDGK